MTCKGYLCITAKSGVISSSQQNFRILGEILSTLANVLDVNEFNITFISFSDADSKFFKLLSIKCLLSRMGPPPFLF